MRFNRFALGVVLVSMIVVVAPVGARAEVVRIEVDSREVVSDAPEHERTGPYEVLSGTVHFEVDPEKELLPMRVIG